MSFSRSMNRVAAAAVTLSLLLISCGGDDESSPDDVDTTAVDTNDEAASDTSDGSATDASDDGAADTDADASDTGGGEDGSGADDASDDPEVALALEGLADFLAAHPVTDDESSTTIDGCPLIDTATLSAAQQSIGGEPIGDDLQTSISADGPPHIQVGCGVGLDQPAGDTPLVAVAAGNAGDTTLDQLVAQSPQELTVDGDRAVGCDPAGGFCLAFTLIDGLAVSTAVNGDQADEQTTLDLLDDIRSAVIDTLAT